MEPQTVVYTRISTSEQNNSSQLSAIRDFMARPLNNTDVHIFEQCSGATPWRERKLSQIFTRNLAPAILITYELSRLGRTTLDVLQFLAECRAQEITVKIVKGNMTIDESIGSKVMTTIIALASELERDFIRARTIEGLAAARARGRIGGRRPGPTKSHQLDPKAPEIKRLRDADVSITSIAKLLGVSRNTVYRFLARPSPTTTTTQ